MAPLPQKPLSLLGDFFLLFQPKRMKKENIQKGEDRKTKKWPKILTKTILTKMKISPRGH